VDTLPASDLSHYFVSGRVISLADHEEITKPTTPSHMAVQLLLSRVATPLEAGDTRPLDKLLKILEYHGNGASKVLSAEIKAKLLGAVTESSQKGNKYIYSH